MTAPDNPPAFPSPYSGVTISAQEGMTLRDYFAGQALAGILASYSNANHICSAEVCANEAYSRADAMLAARQRPAQKGEGRNL